VRACVVHCACDGMVVRVSHTAVRLASLLDALCVPDQIMHAEGLVHRDVKPANIMRCRGGHAGEETYKLIDFGTALGVDERVAKTAMMTVGGNRGIGAGTPPYMSPEMFKVGGAWRVARGTVCAR
jgi:serine/threonine protein kinase